ncbi:ABC transporter permease [Bacillus suaedaesalsae]|uniref:ABC transporter permease n=1 Tax=Bacillus suaedaesalsae TaxID=2810349 RepID=A0ABS2DLS2_9BACI|nr:ABC transporter permease [Bacillus suaedaesalsae]MBM6619418.1 ABC transporter permease [Bacillus suaedaesalsae]
MFTAIFGSFESGIIYAIMALGVYLSFRVLDFPDLTVDGSFVTGAAVAATLLVAGVNPALASVAAIFVGFIAGCITGILHTIGKINALLSGILMMIALYSINLRIMGRSNVSLLNTDTLFTSVEEFFAEIGIPSSWGILIFMTIVTFLIKFLVDRFLKTEIGLAVRATGDNQRMIRSFAANTNTLVILGLGLSNALVAFSGSLIAQLGGFADVGMGIGMIIIGLASVIIGEAIFGTKTIVRTTFAVIGGAIIYRIVISMALRVEFLETGDMKLITATIVILALVMPKIIDSMRDKKRKKQKIRELEAMPAVMNGEGEHNAPAK